MKFMSRFILAACFIFAAAAPFTWAQSSGPRPPAPAVMTDELMARLIKMTVSQKESGKISEKVCAIFNLCDGSAMMPVWLAETERPEGLFVAIPLAPGTTDIVIVRKLGTVLECYLTDKKYQLRAAAITNPSGTRLITNELAANKFKEALSHLAREAAEDLPPTDLPAATSKGVGQHK